MKHRIVIRHAVTIIVLLSVFGSAESLKDRREGTAFVVAGDILQIALPASALGYSVWLGDKDGMVSWCLATGSALAVTYSLKYIVGRPRPYQVSTERGTSFPSGHTTAAFVGAAQWQRRYGWRYGIPAYALAATAGYSRVWGGWHYWSDVAAGAAIGTLSAYIFTKPYERIEISGGADNVSVTWRF